MNIRRFAAAVVFIVSIVILYFLLYQMFNSDSVERVDPALNKEIGLWKNKMDSLRIDYGAGYNRIESIRFGPTSDAGHYNRWNRNVVINESIKNDPILVRYTLWHELGHAVFNLNHSNSTSNIMSKVIPTTEFIRKSWVSMELEYYERCKHHEYYAKY